MKPEELKIESPLTQMLLNKASMINIPMSGTFELTPMCNFACKMCYVRKTAEDIKNHTREMMTLEEWIHLAEEAKKAGLLYLLLTGGEPFAWPHFWELYDVLSDMGFLISINSNGSLINEQVIERLKEKPPIRINITLYGYGDESYQKLCGVQGMFSRVDKAIKMLQEENISVKLNGSLTPENVKDLEACIAYAEERNLIYEVNTYMFPPVRRDETLVGKNERFTPEEAAYYRLKSFRLQYGQDRYHAFMQMVSKGSVPPMGLDESCVDPRDGRIRCRAGKASFWVTWDGKITPCGMMPRPDIDIRNKSFVQAWDELVEESEKLCLSGICQKCANKAICHACAAMAMSETGEADGMPVYLCQMVEAIREMARLEMDGKPFPKEPIKKYPKGGN